MAKAQPSSESSSNKNVAIFLPIQNVFIKCNCTKFYRN